MSNLKVNININMESENHSNIHRLAAKEWQCPILEEKYEIMEGELGKGAYGAVYRAKKLSNGEMYAVKKMENYSTTACGFPITTLREIQILQTLNHENILNINEVVYEKGKKDKAPVIYLCLDLMDSDLSKVISRRNEINPLKIYHIQQLLRQIL